MLKICADLPLKYDAADFLKEGHALPALVLADIDVGTIPTPIPAIDLEDEPEESDSSTLVSTPQELLSYNFGEDPNTLLGNRWICRSGSLLLIAQTGLGKSALAIQLSVCFCLGEPGFGIQPVRPLKVLIIQAENDIGDLAEMFQGVVRGLGLEDRIDELSERMVFITDTSHSGESFFAFVRELIRIHQPDIVVIDPLFAVIGGNVSDQQVASAFLRNGLGSIAQETGVVWFIIHHTNKPLREAGKATANASDYSYLGSGSSELANWARAVLVLREAGPDTFELRAAKRGRRAGLVDSAGQPATEIYLRHGSQGICWERAHAPESEAAAAEEDGIADVLAAMETGKAYTRIEVRDVVMEALGVKRPAVMTKGRKANRIYEAVLRRTRVTGRPDCHMSQAVTTVSRDRGVTVSQAPYRGRDSAVTAAAGQSVTRNTRHRGKPEASEDAFASAAIHVPGRGEL